MKISLKDSFIVEQIRNLSLKSSEQKKRSMNPKGKFV